MMFELGLQNDGPDFISLLAEPIQRNPELRFGIKIAEFVSSITLSPSFPLWREYALKYQLIINLIRRIRSTLPWVTKNSFRVVAYFKYANLELTEVISLQNENVQP